MDITVTIPDRHLPKVVAAFADQGLDPTGTAAQQKAAIAAWLKARWVKELREMVLWRLTEDAAVAIKTGPDPLA